MTPPPTVYVVDDEQAVRASLAWLIESVGYQVRAFASSEEFMQGYTPDGPGCLVLDVRMPGMSGLELQERLTQQQIDVPIIFVTGHGDVPMAVRAMKSGAVDFIEKPFNDQVLLDRIHQALSRAEELRRTHEDRKLSASRFAKLTARERQVADSVASGKSSREIAAELGLSAKTVEVHRAHIMRKLECTTLAELVRLHIEQRAE